MPVPILAAFRGISGARAPCFGRKTCPGGASLGKKRSLRQPAREEHCLGCSLAVEDTRRGARQAHSDGLKARSLDGAANLNGRVAQRPVIVGVLFRCPQKANDSEDARRLGDEASVPGRVRKLASDVCAQVPSKTVFLGVIAPHPVRATGVDCETAGSIGAAVPLPVEASVRSPEELSDLLVFHLFFGVRADGGVTGESGLECGPAPHAGSR